MRRGSGEDGAVLVLALVLLLAVSLIVTALLSFLGTSLYATGSFKIERNVEYATTDAVNLAIQNTRYTFDMGNPTPFLNNPTPENCFSAGYTYAGQNTSVHVYCTMVWQPYSANTRIFTYSACTAGTPNDATAADCAAKPLLQAVVAFDDYPSGIATPSPNPTQCQPISANGSCGLSMTMVSWQWQPTVPAVSSVSPSSGLITGGDTVTLNGSGFSAGATVNFTLQSPVAGTYTPQIPATVVPNPAPGCALPTCLQVVSPAISKGLKYTVTVTTPGGTSQTSTNDFTNYVPTFTYTPVTPTVISLAGNVNGGNITGGTPATILGTSFWTSADNSNPAQVFFCPQSSGSCIAGTVQGITAPTTSSPPCSVTSPTSCYTMTALSPAVSSAGTYYIQVQSYGQNSTQTNVTFVYAVQVPLVTSLSPSSGATGSTLTINGTNFLAGATVGFCATGNINWASYTCNTATTAGTVVTVAPNAITLTVPALSAGTYVPIVTVSGADPSQPYDQPSDIFTHT